MAKPRWKQWFDWTLTQSQVLALEAEEDSHVLDGIEEELARFNRLSLYQRPVPPADIDPVYEAYDEIGFMSDR